MIMHGKLQRHCTVLLVLASAAGADYVDSTRYYSVHADTVTGARDPETSAGADLLRVELLSGATEVGSSAAFRRDTSGAGRVVAGYGHVCVAGDDAAAPPLCFGHNGSGQTSVPASAAGVAGSRSLAGGYENSCALGGPAVEGRGQGVVCWGSNRDGQSDAPGLPLVSAVCAGMAHACAVTADAGQGDEGRAVCWGNAGSGRTAPPVGVTLDTSTATSLACGAHHTCTLRASDRAVVCFGRNTRGELSAPEGAFASLSASGSHTCGVRADDASVACWGSNVDGQCDAPGGGFSRLAAGHRHTCGLRHDRTVVCWGAAGYGQLEAPAGHFDWVSSGGDFSCARRLGEAAPTQGRYPEYPLQGPSVLCWGRRVVAAESQLPSWLYWLPRADVRHQQ